MEEDFTVIKYHGKRSYFKIFFSLIRITFGFDKGDSFVVCYRENETVVC